jgi:hypothetical protein
MEVGGQLHAPAALRPAKQTPVPIGQEAEWAPDPVYTRWRREKNPYPKRESNPGDLAPGSFKTTDIYEAN